MLGVERKQYGAGRKSVYEIDPQTQQNNQNVCFQVSNAYLQRDLFSLEKQERAMNLKFGVIYAKSGQLTDDEVSSFFLIVSFIYRQSLDKTSFKLQVNNISF